MFLQLAQVATAQAFYQIMTYSCSWGGVGVTWEIRLWNPSSPSLSAQKQQVSFSSWAHSWSGWQWNSGRGLGVSVRTSEEAGPCIARMIDAAFYASRDGGVAPIRKLTTGFQAVCSDVAGRKGWGEQGGRHTPCTSHSLFRWARQAHACSVARRGQSWGPGRGRSLGRWQQSPILKKKEQGSFLGRDWGDGPDSAQLNAASSERQSFPSPGGAACAYCSSGPVYIRLFLVFWVSHWHLELVIRPGWLNTGPKYPLFPRGLQMHACNHIWLQTWDGTQGLMFTWQTLHWAIS